jgi:hypothetical protein
MALFIPCFSYNCLHLAGTSNFPLLVVASLQSNALVLSMSYFLFINYGDNDVILVLIHYFDWLAMRTPTR